MTLSQPLPPGYDFGPYRIARLIGAGTFGVVYEAQHLSTHAVVALKILRPDLANHAEAATRLLTEGHATALVRHPNVVTVYDIGVLDGVSYLAMELLRGESLSDLLQRSGAMPIEQAVDVMLSLVSGLMAVHREGFIHRDLKPGNVFLAHTPDGRVCPKLLDFGLVKLRRTSMVKAMTSPEAVLGTPCYMSPEQIRESRHVGPEGDQFSLGVTLYEMLTGVRPFMGSSPFEVMRAVTELRPPSPDKLRADVPPGLGVAVMRAMEKESYDRYETLSGFGEALWPYASPAARAAWQGEFDPAASPSGVSATHPLGAVTADLSVPWRALAEIGSEIGSLRPATTSLPDLRAAREARRARNRRELVPLLVMWCAVVATGNVWLRVHGATSHSTVAAPPPAAPAPSVRTGVVVPAPTPPSPATAAAVPAPAAPSAARPVVVETPVVTVATSERPPTPRERARNPPRATSRSSRGAETVPVSARHAPPPPRTTRGHGPSAPSTDEWGM